MMKEQLPTVAAAVFAAPHHDTAFTALLLSWLCALQTQPERGKSYGIISLPESTPKTAESEETIATSPFPGPAPL
jgi:hypothetical protein